MSTQFKQLNGQLAIGDGIFIYPSAWRNGVALSWKGVKTVDDVASHVVDTFEPTHKISIPVMSARIISTRNIIITTKDGSYVYAPSAGAGIYKAVRSLTVPNAIVNMTTREGEVTIVRYPHNKPLLDAFHAADGFNTAIYMSAITVGAEWIVTAVLEDQGW